MYLVQTVAPISEPITLDEAKLFMKVIEYDEDDLINVMITASREYVENYTNRQIMEATFELTTNSIYSGMPLPKNPIQSVTKIEYMDLEGNYQTISTDNYYTYIDLGITKLFINDLPSYKDDMRAFKITFVSGYENIPSSIKTYMKMQVSTMFENREQYVVGASIETNANPMLDKLLNFYRIKPI